MTTTSLNIQRTIKAFEERANARAVAAAELQRLADRATLGLVREELLRGVQRMLAEETEFLTYAMDVAAEAKRRGAAGAPAVSSARQAR